MGYCLTETTCTRPGKTYLPPKNRVMGSARKPSSRARSDFLYDAQSRRAQRIDFTAWNGSSYTATNTTRFVCDAWNLLAEISAANTVSNYYCWGLDLSGSMQGAAGIGGLLAVTRPLTLDTFHFTFDGNGNGNGNGNDLVDTNGVVVAHYEYDPFGRTVAATGPLALENKWRFSTKYTDSETGLVYYGYRYYSPGLGRWISRDPLSEQSRFAELTKSMDVSQKVELIQLTWPHTLRSCGNDLVGKIDPLGLAAHIENTTTFSVLAIGNYDLNCTCKDWINANRKSYGNILADGGINGVMATVAVGVDTRVSRFIDVDGFWTTAAPGTGGHAQKIISGVHVLTDSNIGSVGRNVDTFQEEFLKTTPAIWLANGLRINWLNAITAGQTAGACTQFDILSINNAISDTAAALAAFPDAR